MPKTRQQVAALKQELAELFTKHNLTRFVWHKGNDFAAEDSNKVYFTMGFDKGLYDVFWPPPDAGKKKIRWNNARRGEFSRIVKRHGFWIEFDDYNTVCFFRIEPVPKKKTRLAGSSKN